MTHSSQIAPRLLAWYREHKRDLPWRHTDDPYRILLAEFMLQQTQVDTVIPYYHRFLDRFPTVADLAKASQDDVLKAWEGLGYYARARNLHKAAHAIATDFAGDVPKTYGELKSLPGFGPYTTAAVLSIAYDLDHAVLDGNVIRVLTRLFDIRDDVTQTRVKNRLWELAQALLSKGEAGDHNQAVMELGAMICTPKNPACDRCPVQKYCAAHKAGDPQSLPVKAKKNRAPITPFARASRGATANCSSPNAREPACSAGFGNFPRARNATANPCETPACAAFGKPRASESKSPGAIARSNTLFPTSASRSTPFSVAMSKAKRAPLPAMISRGSRSPISTPMPFPAPAARSSTICDEKIDRVFSFKRPFIPGRFL